MPRAFFVAPSCRRWWEGARSIDMGYWPAYWRSRSVAYRPGPADNGFFQNSEKTFAPAIASPGHFRRRALFFAPSCPLPEYPPMMVRTEVFPRGRLEISLVSDWYGARGARAALLSDWCNVLSPLRRQQKQTTTRRSGCYVVLIWNVWIDDASTGSFLSFWLAGVVFSGVFAT